MRRPNLQTHMPILKQVPETPRAVLVRQATSHLSKRYLTFADCKHSIASLEYIAIQDVLKNNAQLRSTVLQCAPSWARPITVCKSDHCLSQDCDKETDLNAQSSPCRPRLCAAVHAGSCIQLPTVSDISGGSAPRSFLSEMRTQESQIPGFRCSHSVAHKPGCHWP